MARPSIAKSDVLTYVRRYLNDPFGSLWSDDCLNQLISQSEVYIGDLSKTIWIRFPLALVAGTPTYTLNQNIKEITRITYRGFKVEMLSQQELSMLSPVYRTQQSRPRWASWQFDGFSVLRLFPVPAETLPALSVGNQIYTDVNLLNECVISAYVFPTESASTFSLPDYFVRRIVKSYVLWKAFAMEGNGQDMDVASYYKSKFNSQIDNMVVANTRVYASKIRQLTDITSQQAFKHGRPILPPTFGPIV